jgi:vacuolar-type H+-ATPase subunit H
MVGSTLGASVIPILATLWVLVGVLALVWLLTSGRLRLTRQRRPATLQPSTKPTGGDLDAEWIYGDRAERRPQARPAGEKEEAKVEAQAIVKDAELEAREILAAAERARGRVEAELASERAHMAEKSRKLSELLAHALEEVERASANGGASAHEVDGLEALRDELRRAE